MRTPVVHLYTVCWDEADMLGFFFRHYDPFVDRYVVYDDGSTDGSLDLLRAHPKVELRSFARVEAESFVLSHKAMQDEAWKESRGAADWVVVTAIDEHLHLRGRTMRDYLAAQAAQGVTLIPALGFDMNHPVMPDDSGLLVERVTRGRPRIAFNKLSVFRPEALRESGFTAGRHAAEPDGRLRLPARDALMLWHYKHLGFARNAAREAAQAERLGTIDRRNGYGQHYLWGPERLRAFWDEMERESRDLSGAGFDPAAEAARPLWWDARPGTVRAGDAPAPPVRAASAPSVSVLVKSYNHAPYVAQTIRSILDQSFQDFEIVVTDDASSDATAAIVRSFDDSRIHLAVLPENRGISGAMNATIARARGRYLAILNSDDWALPGRLASQAAFLDANPEVSIVFGMPLAVDEGGTPTVPFNDFRAPLRLPDFSRRAWLRQFFFHGNCLCAPTAMIRREAYEQVGAYDPRLTNYQDLDMWIRMLVAGRNIHVLDAALTAFRIRAGDANMSAPRPDTHLRSAFEMTKLLRHFANLDAAAFDEVFGPDPSDGQGEVCPPGMPVPLRVAELARRVGRVEYDHFALEIVYETAHRQEDFDRLRVRAGETDAFGLGAVAARDRVIRDLGARAGFGFTYPVSPAECRILADLTLLYRVVLGRDPDPDGLRHYVRHLRGGQGLRSIAEDFLHSPEFRSLQGTGDGATLLCRQAAGRLPDAGERGLALADLAVALVASPEAASRHSVLAAVYPHGLPVHAPHLYAWWDEERERLGAEQPVPPGDPVPDASLSVIVLIDRPLDPDEQSLLSRQVRDMAAYGQIVLAPVDAASTLFCRRLCRSLRTRSLTMVSAWRSRTPEAVLGRAQRRCRGTFTCLVNRGDVVAAGRLAAVLPMLAQRDVLLCDEDVRACGGGRRDPAFNGRWDPDAGLARPPSALVLFRSRLIGACGGWRGPSAPGYARELLQWDLLLRIGHRAGPARIGNAPLVLVHRRALPARAPDALSEAGAALVRRFLDETGRRSVAAAVAAPGILRLHHRYPGTPKVSILVPTRDRVDLLRPCIESLLARTRYPAFEVLVIDNESSEPETHAFLARAASDPRLRSASCAGVFNWARSNNVGAAQTDGDVLLLLNNDTVVINDDWLDELVSQAWRPEVGVVGAKLSYPDDRVQHAGIEIDPDGEARHGWRGTPRRDPGYLDQLRIVRAVSAVTGACMAFRRTTFDELGGLDETLRVAWNDVDFCLRARAAGYRVLWTPYAELYHHEGATRTFDTSPQDDARFNREKERVRDACGGKLPDLGFQSPNLVSHHDQPYLSTRVLADLAQRHRAD
ncbi:glycosyltransferase [Methylobacterium planeticum]|uniref:Glycosyltransferase n=1 Tax=Methylobacterium planeticum TaxID=2615211 RepID=A0A6N6MLE9_9HYPH|nr:glycosyltransferase [Methylobacterium planeticum]KAB1070552.1 glycosyltransferase [Methylobacterium planeticum]